MWKSEVHLAENGEPAIANKIILKNDRYSH